MSDLAPDGARSPSTGACPLLRGTVDGERLDAEVRYGVDGATWTQAVSARLLDEPVLRSLLDDAGLVFVRWLERPGWFLTRRRG